MKKILLFVLPALLFLSSCKKEESKEVAVSVSPTEITIEAGATGDDLIKTISITTEGKWVISNLGNSWITPEEQSGEGNKSMTITLSANTGTKDRVGKLGVFTDYGKAYIDITQKVEEED